ncbi:hypothetical protein cypCar_00043040 [Cyprinus carpio]|nr:hypothetical protein cypCar_00043040 [Cyprinus carpio]
MKFNPAVSDKNVDYRSETRPEDLTYCLVYVIAADKVSMMNEEVFKKIRYIRENASSLAPNKYSEPVFFHSPQCKECSNSVGVPMSHIFPVKNYHEEIDTQKDVDVLILRALTQIVQIADDLLKRKQSDSEERKCI